MGTPPPIEVASLGLWDSLILMGMALVVFGPRRLPEIARQIGKLMYEVRKASNDFKFQMEEELRRTESEDQKKNFAGMPALADPAKMMGSYAGAASPDLEPTTTEPATIEASIDEAAASSPVPAPTGAERPSSATDPAQPASAAATEAEEPARHG